MRMRWEGGGGGREVDTCALSSIWRKTSCGAMIGGPSSKIFWNLFSKIETSRAEQKNKSKNRITPKGKLRNSDFGNGYCYKYKELLGKL